MATEPAIDELPVSLGIERLLQLRHSSRKGNPSAPSGTGVYIGSFRGRKRGQGTDYDDLRAYSAGDDIRHIDWRASARTQQLHTRLYREETEHRIQLFVDFRDSMFTGSDQLRSVKAGVLAARMLWQASSGGSRINTVVLSSDGILLTGSLTGLNAAIAGCALLANEFSRIRAKVSNYRTEARPKVDKSKAPSQSESRTLPASSSDLLAYPISCQSRQHGSEQEIPLAKAIQWQIEQPMERSTNLWLSGMDFPGEHLEHYLKLLPRHNQALFIHISDPIDRRALPAGRYHYRSSSARHMSTAVNAAITSRLQQALDKQIQQLARQFDELQIPFITALEHDLDVIDTLRVLGHLP